jgi:hypothetical protein
MQQQAFSIGALTSGFVVIASNGSQEEVITMCAACLYLVEPCMLVDVPTLTWHT